MLIDFYLWLLCGSGFSGIRLKISKFYFSSSFLSLDFGIEWSNEIEICNKIFRNISSNIYSLTLPKRPIPKINLCFCFFNQWESLNFLIGLVKFQIQIGARFVNNCHYSVKQWHTLVKKENYPTLNGSPLHAQIKIFQSLMYHPVHTHIPDMK